MTEQTSELIAKIAIELHANGSFDELQNCIERAAFGVLFALEQNGLLVWKQPQ